MLYYDRIYVPKEIDIKKKQVHQKCVIFVLLTFFKQMV